MAYQLGPAGPQGPIPAPKATTAPGQVSALAAPKGPDAGTQFVNALTAFAQHPQQASNMFGSNQQAMPMIGPSPLYQQALAGARSGISQSYANAIADIQNNQRAAGQALGQLPGQVNASYDQALGTIGSADKAISGAQGAAGLGGPAPAQIGVNGAAPSLNAYMQPVIAGIRGSQTADLANVPLLQTGIGQEGARETAIANQDRMNANTALDQTQMQDAAQQQLAQQAQQAQAALAQQQNQNQNSQASALQGYNYSNLLQTSHDKAVAAASTAPGAANAQVLDPKTGAPLGYTNAQLIKAQNSPQFHGHEAMIRAAQGIKDPKQSAAQQSIVWNQIMNDPKVNTNPALLAALKAIFPNGTAPGAAVTPEGAGLNLLRAPVVIPTSLSDFRQ